MFRVTYRTAKYIISASSANGYQSVEALLVQDGTNCIAAELGDGWQRGKFGFTNVYNNYGIKNFIEIGPKSVLTGLLKNTLPQDQIKFDFIGSVHDMEAFLNKDIV